MSATDVTTAEATDAAEAAVEAITSAAGKDATFSMALTQDQKDIREWVHGFAADVMRPVAHEWDEKESTPWPVIQEAAKIGLYGFEGLAQFFADPTGITLPMVNEELSMPKASEACLSGATGRVLSRRSRSDTSRRTSSNSAAVPRARSSSKRRCARTSTLAVRKNLASALGKTTVPMSRPSSTTPPAAPRFRCISSNASRTAGTAETLLAP